MKIAEFDFDLPPELIAQSPLADRASSRMLVVNPGNLPPSLAEGGKGGGLINSSIKDFIKFLRPGDVVVFNNSKVIPCRFDAEGFEITLHTKTENGWWGFAKKFNKLKIGNRLKLRDGSEIEIIDKNEDSGLLIKFDGDVFETLERVGKIPLPPYIRRPDDAADRARYQTVYADPLGSMAAPTAGLHFTPELLREIKKAGAEIVNITLHVGAGTWMPVKVEDTKDHKMHSEFGIITEAQSSIINKATRVIAIGTTSLRLLESAALANSKLSPCGGVGGAFFARRWGVSSTRSTSLTDKAPNSPLAGESARSADGGYRQTRIALLENGSISGVGDRYEFNTPKHQYASERLRDFSHEMRQNMTLAEKKFWYSVNNKKLGVKFTRQFPINDKYIADFVCLEKKLIIEIDGAQHYKNQYDENRTEYLKKFGFDVVRFWNEDVLKSLDWCLEIVSDILNNDSFDKRLKQFLLSLDTPHRRSAPTSPQGGSLESNLPRVRPFSGATNIFITPGYEFKVVDVLLTNFHLPKSTLFMLVSAFAGTKEMKAAYARAILEKYRFFSYGDCCLLFKKKK